MRSRGTFLGFVVLSILTGVAAAQEAGDIRIGPSYSQSFDSAQTDSAAPANAGSNDGWKLTVYPFYVFGMSAKGTVGVNSLTAPVDASLSDLLSKTNFIYESAVDVRKGRFGFLVDFNYVDLNDEQKFAPPSLFAGSKVNAKLLIFDPEVYVRAVDSRRASLDFMLGLRYWHLSDEIQFLPSIAPGRAVSGTDNWVDPVMGGRILVHLDSANKWVASVKGDAGAAGNGSDLTWQALGGVTRVFKDRYRLYLGYRGVAVDRRNGGSIFDLTFQGPTLGFGIDFK
jgi:hypothetical protein